MHLFAVCSPQGLCQNGANGITLGDRIAVAVAVAVAVTVAVAVAVAVAVNIEFTYCEFFFLIFKCN